MSAGLLIVIIIVIALIGFRAGRAVSMDDIGEPIRRLSRDLCDAKPDSRVRHWFVGLVKCPHCIGFWLTIAVGLVVTAVWLDAELIDDVIIIAAATGAQSLFSTFAQEEQVAMEFKAPEPEEASEAGKSDVVPPEGILGSQ
jgi:Protein of unknown function (DUF1360)